MSSKNTSNPPVPPLELINDSPDSSDGETEKQDSRTDNLENPSNRDISPESGIDLASRGTTGITEDSEETMISEETDRTIIPPNELFNFDLTNPDDVMKMLENVNLSDEDTDVLLQEAYNVNMKLKEILRRQEQAGGKMNQADIAKLKGSNTVVVPGPGKKGSSSNSRAGSAKRSQFAKAEPLPPISNGPTPSSNMRIPSAVYSAKLHRAPAPPSASQSQKRLALSSQDKRMGSRNPSAAMHQSRNNKKATPISTDERPGWNDRFMY
ncbi:uncharacterized protein LOC127733259 isoform X2 [Mytilus californianus]|uniref:uncharacterized protein LOC127733259 isoform X2 n=1 Tax=Mytilus californianus TaxID=6549 RepID=UPI0022485813|nr:uncharacterized protein LOC127733259 isoform X2 [Mytilus californianus]